MKTRNAIPVIPIVKILLATLLLTGAHVKLHAQLVADGDSLNLTTATNLGGPLNVGIVGGNTTLNIITPGTLTSGVCTMGALSSSTNNTVTVQNSGAFWALSGLLQVGPFGSGNLVAVSNGGMVFNSSSCLIGGSNTGSSNNTVIVTGSGSHWRQVGQIAFGVGGGNQLIVTDGATMYGYPNFINYGGRFVVSNGAAVTNSGIVGLTVLDGQLFVSNATLRTATTTTINIGSSGSPPGRMIVDGGMVLANGLNVVVGTNVLNAGLIQAVNLFLTNELGFLQLNGGALSVSNSLVDNGSPMVVGNGSSPATYELLGNGLHRFRHGLVIANNAQLAGNGIVVGGNPFVVGTLTVQGGGSVSPGPSIGRLVLTNSPSLQGTLYMEISKTGITLTNDQIQVIAALTYGGSLSVSNLGDPLQLGNVFPLFDATSYGGSFTALNLPVLKSGLMWTNRLRVNGSIAVVPQTPPAISGVTQSGTNLLFNVTGGSPGGGYTVVASTNITVPWATWTVFNTGNFDWMGSVTVTNSTDPATPRRFFTVRVP